MQSNELKSGEVRESRVRKAVNELVLAEMFLVQATVESANVISQRIDDLKQQLNGEREGSLAELLARTADEAVEPYSTRYRYRCGAAGKTVVSDVSSR